LLANAGIDVFELCPHCDDYPIFFATQQHKNNSGNKVLARDAETGKLLLDKPIPSPIGYLDICWLSGNLRGSYLIDYLVYISNSKKYKNIC
jgi:hypothetical protein